MEGVPATAVVVMLSKSTRKEGAEEERGVRVEERRRWCLLTLAAGNGVAVWDEARVGWAGMDETALRRRATGMRRRRAGCTRLLHLL